MTTPYEKNMVRITSLINVIRRQNLQDIEPETSESGEEYYPNPEMLSALDKIEDEIQASMREEGYVNFMRPGKGYKVLPEFTMKDAETIIHETTIRWLNNDPHGQDVLRTLNNDSVFIEQDGTYTILGSASLNQGNGLALKQEFAEMMLSNFEFDLGKVNIIEPDYADINDRSPQQIKNAQDGKRLIIDQMDQQIWNDSSVIRNIDVIYRSAEAALANGYLGQDPDFELAMFNLITGVETDFPQELLGDGLTIGHVNQWAANWENTVIENDHELREYLISGEVRDDTGNIVSKVSSHNEKDAKDSLILLAKHEKYSDRVLDGTALIPQAGNTVSEQRQRRMAELMGSWGWDDNKSTANNLDRILSTQGRDPGNKLTFPDGDERYALRQERDEMAARIDAKMLASTFNEGSDLYNDLLFKLVDQEFGEEYSGYDARVAQTLTGLNALEWKLDTRTGMDNAAETVLDHHGLLKSEISEESFNALSKAMSNRDEEGNLLYGSLGEAMSDPTMWATINAARDQKELEDAEEEATKDRTSINKPGVLQAGILAAARSIGIIDSTTSSKFQTHFEKNVLPEIQRRIMNAGGIQNISDIERYVANAVRPGDVFKTYDLDEEAYTQHFDPGSPPPIPSMYMPGLPGFGDPNTAGTMKYIPPVFDISSLTPELQWLAYERPEFAEFLADEMQTQEYKDAFQKAAAPQFDEEEYTKQISGLWEQQIPKYEEYQDSLGKAATAKQAQEDYAAQIAGEDVVGGEGEGAMPEEPLVPTSPEGKAYIDQAAADAAAKVEGFFGPPPPAVTDEGEAITMPGLKGAPFFALDPSWRKEERERLTTAGQTSEEFFKSKMPGFEERFKQTPFFQQQEERIKREGERALSEERRVESERRRRVSVGTGGRGLTVFRRRQ